MRPSLTRIASATGLVLRIRLLRRAAQGALLFLLASAASLAGDPPTAPEGLPPTEADDYPPVGYTSRRRFGIGGYEDKKDLARVELHVTEDGGKTWRLYGYDDDCVAPVGFETDHDGSYGFYVVLQDRAGHRAKEPESGAAPQVVVVVDTVPPGVELVSPNGGFFGRRKPVVVSWRAPDEHPAEGGAALVECSPDAGKTWHEVASGRESAGRLAWSPHAAGGEAFRDAREILFRVTVRDRAGNSASAVSRKAVRLDDAPPSVRATGPSGSTRGEVPVTYEAKDESGSGVESVRLFVTPDGGATWKEAALDEDGASPLAWRPAAKGSFGLYLVATDGAGNSSPEPVGGDAPALLVEAVPPGPEVFLRTLTTGGDYKGGSERAVEWHARGPGADRAEVKLEYSLDGGKRWTEIARGLPPEGSFNWTLPRADTERALVRVTASAESGAAESAVSGLPFTIDSTPPRATARFDEGVQDDLVALAVREPPPLRIPEREPEPVAVPPPGERRKGPPPREIRLARGHLRARRYDEAMGCLKPLIAREPENVEANCLFGEALARSTDRLAGKLRPRDLLRKYDEAASVLRLAVEADGTSEAALVWLGACLLQKARALYGLRDFRGAAGEAERALGAYEGALEMGAASPGEYYHAGLAAYVLALAGPTRVRPQGLARARELLTSSLAGARPEMSGSAHYYLAEIARQGRDRAAELAHWRKALALLGEGSGFAPGIRQRIARLEGE